MNIISENTVKRVVLPFLKHYYKFRPRGEGPTRASLNMRAEGGIIADGFLTFKKEDGSPFLGTFEATSYESRGEVLFRVQKHLLFWDSLTTAVLLVSFFIGYMYGFGQLTLRPAGLVGAIGLVWLGGLVVFLLAHMILRRLRRYRYIYAVEQFKRYFADDQWIAVAEDVFPHSNDVRLRELKEQCVKHGFGLIIVGLDEQAHPVITPSRQDLFRGKRQRLNFLDASNWRPSGPRMNKGILQFFPFLTGKKGKPDSLMRFQRTYYNQMVLVALGLIVLGYVFWEEFKIPDVQRLDEEEFEERMVVSDRDYTPESPVYEIDSAFLYQFREKGKPKEKKVYEPIEQPRKAEAGLDTAEASSNKIVVVGEEEIDVYDCSRFYNLDGVKYLLIYDVYREEVNAIAQLDTLRQRKLDANILWLGCFDKTVEYFVVYLGLIYNDAEEARRRRSFFVPVLASTGIDTSGISIRAIAEK